MHPLYPTIIPSREQHKNSNVAELYEKGIQTPSNPRGKKPYQEEGELGVKKI
jgi:hypothetical protein